MYYQSSYADPRRERTYLQFVPLIFLMANVNGSKVVALVYALIHLSNCPYHDETQNLRKRKLDFNGIDLRLMTMD